MTPQAVDGRSNRRRFSDEQKRAIVQETEKPGASAAQACRRYGVATGMVFRWRVDFNANKAVPAKPTTELAALARFIPSSDDSDAASPVDASKSAVGDVLLCQAIVDHMHGKFAAQSPEYGEAFNRLASRPQAELLQAVSRQICPTDPDRVP